MMYNYSYEIVDNTITLKMSHIINAYSRLETPIVRGEGVYLLIETVRNI